MQLRRTTDHGFAAETIRSERNTQSGHDTLRSPPMSTAPPASEPGPGDLRELHAAMSSGLQRLLKGAYDGGDAALEGLVRRYVRSALVLRDVLLYATSLSKAYPSASALHAAVLTASIRYAYAWAIDQLECVGSVVEGDATDTRRSSASVEALAALGALVEAHASGPTVGATTLGRTLLAIDEAVYRLGVERDRIADRAALPR